MSDDFFEPPPPPEPEPEPESPPTPPWFGAPRGMLPGVVALDLVVARNDQVAVCVARLAGYPTGFEFELRTIGAPGRIDPDLDPLLFGPHRHRARRAAQSVLDDMLRFGVQFSDGRKATNTGGFYHQDDPPPGPVMHSGGGGGGGGDWHQDNRVWPLPPPGPLRFVCEWPAVGIPVSRAEIDAELVVDAASRAQRLFPDSGEPPAGGSGWTSYAPLQRSPDSP
jgi:hypothetical protein